MTSPLLQSAAFHEAGHVVVARLLGLPIGKIEIRDDGGGRSQIGESDHLPLVDQIAVCLAGIETQELFKCAVLEIGAADDYGKIITLTPDMTEAEREAIMQAGGERARELLRRSLDEVERLARRLIEHRRVRLDRH